MEKNLENKREFFKCMLTLAIPIVIQNLISSSLNLVDNVMIGRLGGTEIAAVGLANQFYFLCSLLIFGINSGCAIYISQFWGKRDENNIRKVIGMCILIGGSASAIFAIGAIFFPQVIMNYFIKDSSVVSLGCDYLRIVGISYVFTAISYAYSFASRCVGQAKLPMVTSGVAILCNTTLNFILIFGMLGFPALGVKGAAIATTIARLVELLLITTIIYSRNGVLAAKIKEIIHIDKAFYKKVLITISPVILNEFFWALGMTLYSVAYAKINKDAVAAVEISNTVKNIFMVAAFGLANSCAVMIGNEIGSGKEENAMMIGRRFIKLTLASGVVLGLCIFMSKNMILSLFNISPDTLGSARSILTLYSVILPLNMFSSLFVVGIFRSGGDTRFSMCLEIGTVWFIGVPMAFLGAVVLKFPIHIAVLMVGMELVVKIAIAFPRYKSKKWIRNLVQQIS